MKRETGIYQTLGELHYFIPHALPPTNPPLELSPEIMSLYGQTTFNLGQLNAISKKLPDTKRFIKAYVIKEALLTSAIEGIHTTLINIFTHPLEGAEKPNKETQLVLNYSVALDVAVKMLKEEQLPLTSKIILAAHHALMSTPSGGSASPGSYRKQSVKVGTLIPPPVPEITKLMSDLEKYINEPSDLPPLIRAGLVHVQFETIHPFLDGNGRIGRLLIILMLINDGILMHPILYPSYYFKKHHAQYYQMLNAVNTKGDFESWIIFYLNAINESALDAHRRAQEIEALETSLQEKIQTNPRYAKIKDMAAAALPLIFAQPIIGIGQLSKALDIAYNTAHNLIKHFIAMDILVEHTNQKRNKLYRFEPYLVLLEKEF